MQRTYSYYNLDMIISLGFRVNSKKAIKSRTWANKIIEDYMIQGFALNDDRFMKARKTDQEYFKSLLKRIKLISTSERMFYQKIADIFAECSIDYNKSAEFYKREIFDSIAITSALQAFLNYNQSYQRLEKKLDK